MANILCFGAGWQQYNAIRNLIDSGHTLCVVDADRNARGFDIANIALNIDIKNYQSVLDKIKKIKIDAAISPNNDAGQFSAYKISIFHKLRHISFFHYKIASQKLFFRSFLRKNKKFLPQPKFFSFEGIIDIENKINSYFLGIDMLIFKPDSSSGSRGITVLKKTSSSEEIRLAANKALFFSATKKGICEEFISGAEYSIEIYTYYSSNHLICAISKRHMFDKHSAYAIEEIEQDSEVFTLLKKYSFKLLNLLEYKRGPCHLEVILTKDRKIYPLDIAFRGGGFWVADKIVRNAIGDDINNIYVNDLLKIKQDFFLKENKKKLGLLVFNKPSVNSAIQKHINLIKSKYSFQESLKLAPSNMDPDSDASRTSIEFYLKK